MKPRRLRLPFDILLWMVACLVLFSLSVSAQETNTVEIDATDIIAEVSPYAYGANFGPLSTVPFDLFDEAQASGISFLRFPGGRWGDLNDLQPFHIDNYMTTVDLLGVEPSIHVRLENGTPEAAAELVRYTNIENDYNVTYWYIGNEPNLFDDYTVAEMVVQWRAIAEAMRAVDPNIILIGPELSQWNGTPQIDPVDPDGVDWLRGFLQANGDIVDIVAVHRYPFPLSQANPVSTIEQLRGNTPEWSVIVENLRQVVLEETGRDDIPVAITEASSHWSASVQGEASPDSHFHAIWWADSLGRMLEDNPFIVAYFELQTPTSRGGWGLLGNYEVRPTYYVYQLYQQFGVDVVRTESSAEYLSVFAALREDGALTVMAVNRGDEDIQASTNITGFEGAITQTYLFTEDILAEEVENTYWVDDALTLPGRSVALFILETP